MWFTSTVSSNDQFQIFERATRISSLEIPIQFAAVVGVNMLLLNWQYKPAGVYVSTVRFIGYMGYLHVTIAVWLVDF